MKSVNLLILKLKISGLAIKTLSPFNSSIFSPFFIFKSPIDLDT